MKAQSIKCNVCGASLTVDGKQTSNIIECQYCGASITLASDAVAQIASEHIKAHQEETEALLKSKQKVKLEYETKIFQANELKETAKKYLIVGGIVGVVSLAVWPLIIGAGVLIYMGINKKKEAERNEFNARVDFDREMKVLNHRLTE